MDRRTIPILTGLVPDEAAISQSALWVISYTNYRGETSVRRIIPKSVRFGSTEWHPEPQWLLLAWDDDKQADREFALKDFGSPEGAITAYLAQREKEGFVEVPVDRISAIWKEAEDCVPTNWCDGLLTGPKASRVPLDCPAVERLLLGIIKRIRDKAAAAQNGGK